VGVDAGSPDPAAVPTSLGPDQYARLDAWLAAWDDTLAHRYPGDDGSRQPVHTVYVPADRFHAGLPAEWGASAAGLLAEHAPDAAALADVVGIPVDLAEQVRPRLVGKLATEPIEDLRIDFEDGYGPHPDAEEDAVAVTAAEALGTAITAGTAPPYVGIRFKSLEASTRQRGIRTLDIFLTRLAAVSGLDSGLPDGLIVTLPKVTDVAQVEAFAEVCAEWERANGLPDRRMRFEIQVETPQAILAADGTAAVARMLHAAPGRVSGLHYGTYDYSAACGVSAAYQSLEHPVADHAKAVMQVAAAATGVRIADGSTNVLPVGDRAAIHAAWRLHARLVRRSLERAFYQGWDLHPGHLVTRYAATYAFYREGFPAAADRLRAYLGSSTTGVLDEPATAQAMASLLVRGLHSGALDEAEVTERAGAGRDVLDGFYRRRVG
jgi:citrate lyase beta subunit